MMDSMARPTLPIAIIAAAALLSLMLPVIAAAALLSLMLPGCVAKYDPETLRIRAFCIGESYFPETRFPLLVQSDPRIFYVPIPANLAEGSFETATEGGGEAAVRKFMRLYLPRRYDDLVSSYDLAMLSDFEAWIIPNQEFEWMRQAIEEEGMGLIKYEINWDTGGYYMRSGQFIDLWIASAVFEAFPSDFVIGKQVAYANGIIPAENNPVTDLPGIERYALLTSGSYGIETPREGALVLATFRNDPKKTPAMISREYGKGVSLSVLPGLDKIDTVALSQYEYYIDFWINQMYWGANFPIPEDINLVSAVRRDMLQYAEQRPLMISLMDFVEKFGAATLELEKELTLIDEAKAEADRLYMEQDYTESIERLGEVFGMLGAMSTRAMELKDRALFWIYVIEWMVVTGTAMLTGFVLYTLMIKRRYYKEVSSTRAT
jgi:uncharacterized membrane protein